MNTASGRSQAGAVFRHSPCFCPCCVWPFATQVAAFAGELREQAAAIQDRSAFAVEALTVQRSDHLHPVHAVLEAERGVRAGLVDGRLDRASRHRRRSRRTGRARSPRLAWPVPRPRATGQRTSCRSRGRAPNDVEDFGHAASALGVSSAGRRLLGDEPSERHPGDREANEVGDCERKRRADDAEHPDQGQSKNRRRRGRARSRRTRACRLRRRATSCRSSRRHIRAATAMTRS